MTAHYALPPSTAPDTCVQGGYTRCRWKSGGSVTHDVASSESRSGRPGAERARTATETSDQRLTYEDALKLKSSTPVAPWTRRASYRGERRFPPLRSAPPRELRARARPRGGTAERQARRGAYMIQLSGRRRARGDAGRNAPGARRPAPGRGSGHRAGRGTRSPRSARPRTCLYHLTPLTRPSLQLLKAGPIPVLASDYEVILVVHGDDS